MKKSPAVTHRGGNESASRPAPPSETQAIDTLSKVAGLYAVTEDGTVGVYDKNKELVPDPELTRAFAPQVRQLLAAHLAGPESGAYRVGVIYRAPEQNAWGTDTFLLETSVVREVYPVGGPSARELTAFQKKNRVKSIYRAMELLMEYRYDTAPKEPVYCPLLYDGGALLDEPAVNRSVAARVPVIEVLNLMAVIPFGRRNTPDTAKLIGEMHARVVCKSMRRRNFTLTELRAGAPAGSPGAVDFFDVDKRHDRVQTFEQDVRGRVRTAEQTQRQERFNQVEQWLERPHRAVDPALLRTFAQFRDIDSDRLALLAEKALVYTAPGGARLLNMGMKDSWNMYLLEGTVSLHAADGGSLVVAGGTDKAASPISFLKPRKYTVTAITPVSFLWIHDALLEAVLAPPRRDSGTASAVAPKLF